MTEENSDLLKQFLKILKPHGSLILLLQTSFLSGKCRKDMLEKSPLKHVYIHSGRLTMYHYGAEKPKHSGTKQHAWMVWEKDYSGPAMMHFL